MDYDKLFKEYCQKQNPNETISGGCAVFVLGFVDFLKSQAVEQSVQADLPSVAMCQCGAVGYESHKRWCPANTSNR